jgi:hypothetical protein
MPEYSAVDCSHHFRPALKHHQRSSLAFLRPRSTIIIVAGNARLPPMPSSFVVSIPDAL